MSSYSFQFTLLFLMIPVLGMVSLGLVAKLLFYKYVIQQKRCTEKTVGVVKKYRRGTSGGENSTVHLPIVRYVVEGKEYLVRGPEYLFYLVIVKKGPKRETKTEWKIKGQNIKLKYSLNSMGTNTLVNPMCELYPIGTEVDVFYDRDNPKLAYVERYCNRKIWFYMNAFFSFVCAVMVVVICVLAAMGVW